MKISLKFVAQGPINNIGKPLSETMMAYLNGAYMRHSVSMS